MERGTATSRAVFSRGHYCCSWFLNVGLAAWSVCGSVWPPRSSDEYGPPLMDQTVVLCTLVAFLLYYNTLYADFAYDDR